MKIADAIIIYFACGAPLSVYYLTQSRAWSIDLVLWLCTRWLCWPYYGVKLFIERFCDGIGPDQVLDAGVLNIQAGMERIVYTVDHISLYEFRETFDRYTGLTRTIAGVVRGKPDTALFDAARHGSPDLAAVCLDRRNRERLKFHQACSRNEMVDLVSAIALSADHRAEIVDLAKRLAELLNDQTAFDEFQGLAGTRSATPPANGTPPRSHAISNRDTIRSL